VNNPPDHSAQREKASGRGGGQELQCGPNLYILSRPPQNGNLLRQQKNPDRVSAHTPRALDFFASLHLTIFERPANFEFFEQSDFIAKSRHPLEEGDPCLY
jgi:hypothetical protein